MNLIANAIESILENENPGENENITISTQAEKDCVKITVADTGPGIPNEILNKIFDPFFTTKEPGTGTGMGLSITNDIIREHRGKIWVRNLSPSGTEFTIELPTNPSKIN